MSRIWTIAAFIVLFYTVIIVRLFYWQIVRGTTLRLEAQMQHSIQFRLPSWRGFIFDAHGEPLVSNQDSYLLYANPQKIENIGLFSQVVSTILATDQASISGKLYDQSKVWVLLGRKVDTGIIDKLKLLDLPGLGFEKEPKRLYPEGSMAAQLLGFIGSDQNGLDTGYFGIEGFYDRDLRGKDGMLGRNKDVRGDPILIGQEDRVDAEDGRNLVLWVDKTIQYIAETGLEAGIKKYGATSGAVLIMDPATGGILASASYPSYDPGDWSAYDSSLYKNPNVASSYEPGSTFKVLVMAAGINEGLLTPDTIVDESGPIRIGEYLIRTWDNTYHGKINMTTVLERSSNVGMVFIERLLGKDKLLSYIKNYGFGETTGIDIQEESSPALRDDNDWKEIDLATASFGQGIAVTPIQMIRAVSTIANGGYIMEPHIVKEIRDKDGNVKVIKPKRIRQVISPQAARIVTEMMVNAVDKGEAKWAKPKGYRIAGKTGTAQIPVAGHYDDKKTIASFVGFAPADNPRFVMLVTLREPSSSQWGSETAAPLFFSISKEIFGYLGLPPQ